MNKIKKLNRKEKGSVLVEAALVIPLMLAVTFFIIEFGNAFYLLNTLNQIARTAARYASVTPSYTNQQLIDASGANTVLPDISKLTLTVNPIAGSSIMVGTVITVNVGYNYTPIVNPFGIIGSSNAWAPVIKSSSVVRSEVSNGA